MRRGTVLEVRDEGLRLLAAVSDSPAQVGAGGGLARLPPPEECR